MCIKGLRLVTIQLPENFSPIGEGTNRISHIRISQKFVCWRCGRLTMLVGAIGLMGRRYGYKNYWESWFERRHGGKGEKQDVV
jgi:hypothetical protein